MTIGGNSCVLFSACGFMLVRSLIFAILTELWDSLFGFFFSFERNHLTDIVIPLLLFLDA